MQSEGEGNIRVCLGHAGIFVGVPLSIACQDFPFLVLCVKVEMFHSGHVVEQPQVYLAAVGGPGAKLELAALRLLWPHSQVNLAEGPELGWRDPQHNPCVEH